MPREARLCFDLGRLLRRPGMARLLIAGLLAAATCAASPSVPQHTAAGSVQFLSPVPNNIGGHGAHAAAPALPPPPTSSPPVGPIRRWLANLTFSVPDLSVTVGASVFETTVNLTKLVCHHVQLSSISLPTPTPASSPTAITLGVHGLGVSCYGLWDTLQHDWPHARLGGTVNVSVGGDTGVRLGVDVHRRKDDGLPGTVVPTDCGANLTIADVAFHGDGTGILNPVLKLLKPAIGNAAAKAICPPNNLTGSVAGSLATALTKVFNDSDSKIAPFLKPVPPAIPPPVGPGMFNLQDNSLVQVLDNILDNLLGYQGINGIVDFFTHPNNGTANLSKILKNKTISFNVSNIAMVTLGLDDLVLYGLDTWSMFDFFRPVSKYSLNSVSATDNLAVNLTFNVRVDFIGPKAHSSVLHESGVLFMNLSHNVLNTTMQVAVRKAPMEALTTRQVANMDCLLSTVADFNLTQLTLNTSVRNLSLAAVDGNVEKDFDAAIDALLGLAVHAFGPSIPAYLNGAVIEQLRLLANEAVANASATAKCKADTALKPLTYDPVWIKIAFCGCTFLSLVGAIVLWRNACRWDRGMGMHDDGAREALLSVNGGGSVQAEAGAGAGATALEDHRRKTASLAMQTAAAWYWRYGVPFLLWMCAAMFITSNTGVGAGVYITVNLDGHILKLPSVFSFTLGNSVKQMWQAGVYPLSILVATFSGTWPYAKLVMMMVAWVCPVRYLPVRVREGILMFLDKFGKWSLLDSFILLFMVVGFHVNVPLAATSSVDVFVEPGFGTYFLLGSTILSLLLTHVVLHFHRQNTAGYKTLGQSGGDQPSRSLYRQVTEVSFPVVRVRRRRRGRARNGGGAAAVYEGEGILPVSGTGTDTDTDTETGTGAAAATAADTGVAATANAGTAAFDSASAATTMFGVRYTSSDYLIFQAVSPSQYAVDEEHNGVFTKHLKRAFAKATAGTDLYNLAMEIKQAVEDDPASLAPSAVDVDRLDIMHPCVTGSTTRPFHIFAQQPTNN
eukprot:m.473765 g.473765  ORF g.473765 m.473765 type:complete len:1012 (-) comp20388_c0_seq17:25-3060(-)